MQKYSISIILRCQYGEPLPLLACTASTSSSTSISKDPWPPRCTVWMGMGAPPASESFFGIVLVKFPHVVNGSRAMGSDVLRAGKAIARNVTRDRQGAATQRRGPAIYRHCSAPCRPCRPCRASTAYAMHRASDSAVPALGVGFADIEITATCKSVSEIPPGQPQAHQTHQSFVAEAGVCEVSGSRQVAQPASAGTLVALAPAAPPIAAPARQLASTSTDDGAG